MAKTSELNPQANENYRLHREFSRQSLLVAICGIALIVSVLALLMAWMAVQYSMQANFQANAALESNAELKKEVRLTQMEIDDFRISLIRAGIELSEHEGDKP